MPIPNHQQELTDHIETSLSEAYGKDASGGEWYEDQESNVKNKYAIVREYRQLHLEEIKELVKARMNAVLGVFILTHASMRMEARQMNRKNFNNRLGMQIYLGTTNLRGSQLGGDRIVYEMTRDFIQVLIDNPLRLTGNPRVGFNIDTVDADNTDEEIDFIKAEIALQNTILKDV